MVKESSDNCCCDIGHGHGHGFDRINISCITIYQYFDNEDHGGQLC